MRRVLKWLLGFVGALVLVWVITVLIGMNEKPEVTLSAETTYFVEPVHADGTVNYVAALNARYGEGVTPDTNAAVVLLSAVGPRLLDDAVRDKTAELMGVEPPPADGEYCQTLKEYFESLPPGQWPLALSNGQELTAEKTKVIRAQFDKLADVGGQPPPDLLAKHGLREPYQLLREQRYRAMRRPWSTRQYPALAGWLNANAEALNKLADLAGRSRYFIPLVSSADPPSVTDVLGAEGGRVRALATALLVRAMLKLDSPAHDQAWQDLRLAFHLAGLLSRSVDVFERDTAAQMAARASAAACTLASSGLSRGQARRFLADVTELLPLGEFAETIDVFKRCWVLDMVMGLMRGDGGDDMAPLNEARSTPINWDHLLRRVNAYYDLATTECRDRHCEEGRRAGVELDDMRVRLREKVKGFTSTWMTKRLILRGVPVVGRRVNTQAFGDLLMAVVVMMLSDRKSVEGDIAQMRLRLTELAFAVAAHEAETGELPGTLAQIAPKYVQQLPLDPLTRKPYVYARDGRSAVLYSLGKNGRDDGGRSEPDQSGGADDIAVRFKR